MTSKQRPIKSYAELAKEWEPIFNVLFGAEQSEIERRQRMLNIKHDYKGYVYIPEEDSDEDNVKIKHVIWFANRIKFHDTSHSPYSVMSRDDFEAFIDSHIKRRMDGLRLIKEVLLGKKLKPEKCWGKNLSETERALSLVQELYEEEANR